MRELHRNIYFRYDYLPTEQDTRVSSMEIPASMRAREIALKIVHIIDLEKITRK